MEILVDHLAEYNDPTAFLLFYWSSDPAYGQTFSCDVNCLFSHCKFYLKKTTGGTGTITARLYAMTGTYGTTGKPTGTPIAETSAINISSLSDSVWALTDFVFSSGTLNGIAGTKYCIVLYSTNANSVYMAQHDTDPSISGYHNGNAFELSNGITWQELPGKDCIFYVYGTIPDPVNTGNFFLMFL
jgi:hypothetical protein